MKRGTNRASFISTDAAADKFNSAEDALFGPRTRKVATPEMAPNAAAAPAAAKGRVLRDLHEPPPPPPPEAPAPGRRGRKPGSKNKPKPPLIGVLVSSPIAAPVPTMAAASRAPDGVQGSGTHRAPTGPGLAASLAGDRATAAIRTPRLRERSTILKRYVLGTEPAPGQAGWARARRLSRGD